jgi:hypothetical protein
MLSSLSRLSQQQVLAIHVQAVFPDLAAQFARNARSNAALREERRVTILFD